MPSSLDRITPVHVATLAGHSVWSVSPLSGQRWFAQCRTGELLVVDHQLRPLWSLAVDPDWRGRHAVSDDVSHVALSLKHEVALLDARGSRIAAFPHYPWGKGDSEHGCCAFASCGRYLWATVPTFTPEQPLLADDAVWLIDVPTRSLLDERRLNVAEAGCSSVHHPDGETIGLDIGEGQDGSPFRWVKPVYEQDGGSAGRVRIDVRFAPGIDRVLADVHPEGQEYVTTPHGFGSQELIRHRFADDAPIEKLAAPTEFSEEDQWDYYAGYVTDELILASTSDGDGERHLLVEREPMRLAAVVDYPLQKAPGPFFSARNGHWLTVDRSYALHRWRLPG